MQDIKKSYENNKNFNEEQGRLLNYEFENRISKQQGIEQEIAGVIKKLYIKAKKRKAQQVVLPKEIEETLCFLDPFVEADRKFLLEKQGLPPLEDLDYAEYQNIPPELWRRLLEGREKRLEIDKNLEEMVQILKNLNEHLGYLEKVKTEAKSH